MSQSEFLASQLSVGVVQDFPSVVAYLIHPSHLVTFVAVLESFMK
jgi:hypothetical protein